MAKNNATNKIAADEVKTNSDLPPEPIDSLEEERIRGKEREDMLVERLMELEKRLERAEYSGGSKNKARVWDEMNDADENVRYGVIPSFDGKDPIINWETIKGSKVSIDYARNVRDDQSWIVETKSGEKSRILVSEVGALVSGNGIHARINDWKKYMDAMNEINDLQHRYQRAISKRSSFDTKGALDKIEQLKNNLKINITLSEDRGKSYNGETFDILARMWNAHA